VLHLAMTEGTPRPRESAKNAPPKPPVEHEHEIEQGGRVVAGAVLAGLAGAYLLTRRKKHGEEE